MGNKGKIAEHAPPPGERGREWGGAKLGGTFARQGERAAVEGVRTTRMVSAAPRSLPPTVALRPAAVAVGSAQLPLLPHRPAALHLHGHLPSLHAPLNVPREEARVSSPHPRPGGRAADVFLVGVGPCLRVQALRSGLQGICHRCARACARHPKPRASHTCARAQARG